MVLAIGFSRNRKAEWIYILHVYHIIYVHGQRTPQYVYSVLWRHVFRYSWSRSAMTVFSSRPCSAHPPLSPSPTHPTNPPHPNPHPHPRPTHPPPPPHQPQTPTPTPPPPPPPPHTKNIFVKISVVLGSDWPWLSRSNLNLNSKFHYALFHHQSKWLSKQLHGPDCLKVSILCKYVYTWTATRPRLVTVCNTRILACIPIQSAKGI